MKMPNSEVLTRSQVKAIYKATIERIREQGTLPLSPCSDANERNLLCAGALLVRSGLALCCSEEKARDFETALLKTRNKSLILEGAAQIGLSTAEVQAKIALNDSLTVSGRAEGVISYINERLKKLN